MSQANQMFALTNEAIESETLKERLKDDRAGALLIFEGVVRNHNEGKKVSALSYEACESLAQTEAERIFAEARQRFEIVNCIVVHRVGDLQVGDAAVFVGVSTAHRDQAYSASRFLIDEIKKRLPIWKKEHYTDASSAWVNCAHQEADHKHDHRHDQSREHQPC